MLCIEPIRNINFEPAMKSTMAGEPTANNKGNKNSAVIGSLLALAAIGAATIGLAKTKPLSFEEALKKAGVEVKDRVARKISNGEKYTGKIEHFETRNRKETVEYVNGVITEKVYHNAFGKELNGFFYKDGKLKYKVGISGSGKNRHVSTYEYREDGSFSRGQGKAGSDNVFEEYRKLVKSE